MSTKQALSPLDAKQRYESMLKTHHSALFHYALWLCKDAYIAEDLVQETYLKAWKAHHSLHNEKAAKAWLMTILRRENARRYTCPSLDFVCIEEIHPNNSISDDNWHQKQWLQAQILRLENEYRDPLLLQVVGGFNGEEISKILELNKNTVMTRLFRARNQLKALLQHTQNTARNTLHYAS